LGRQVHLSSRFLFKSISANSYKIKDIITLNASKAYGSYSDIFVVVYVERLQLSSHKLAKDLYMEPVNAVRVRSILPQFILNISPSIAPSITGHNDVRVKAFLCVFCRCLVWIPERTPTLITCVFSWSCAVPS
jgi:hypothetical protein